MQNDLKEMQNNNKDVHKTCVYTQIYQRNTKLQQRLQFCHHIHKAMQKSQINDQKMQTYHKQLI